MQLEDNLLAAHCRRKAEASEAMVQEICRDIRKLDRAKGHLQVTITSLRRLAMLVDAVGEGYRLLLLCRSPEGTKAVVLKQTPADCFLSQL